MSEVGTNGLETETHWQAFENEKVLGDRRM